MVEYIEDIRRLRRDMDFMFEWQKQYQVMFLTREHKSISTSNRLMFCLLYGLIQSDKNTHKNDM